MSNRIDQCFAQLKAAGRTGLIPFVTAGDPLPGATVPLLHSLVAAGADLIEIGRAVFRSDGRRPGDPARQ